MWSRRCPPPQEGCTSSCRRYFIDNVQNKAIRVFLGVNRFAANLAINGDMGWTPSHIRRKLAMVRYWNKLVSMEDNIIAKRVFETILLQNSTKWLKTLTEILTNIGLYDCIQSRSKCDIRECREALLNKHKADWQRMVPTKPKFRSNLALPQRNMQS